MLKSFEPSNEQKNIINLCNRINLVLAPPGTGKTTILAERINYAIKNGIKPRDMICLTFTNRAARIMRDRVANSKNNNDLFIGNIHQFCFKFIKANKLFPQNITLLDEEDVNDVFEEAKFNLNISTETKAKDLASLNAKLNQRSFNLPDELRNNSFVDIKDINIAKIICVEYEKIKKHNNFLDFDDLLLYTYNFIREESNNDYKKYTWIQVDEAQDLNPLQWKIIDLISTPNAHSVIFADTEQAIFSFIGASRNRLYELAQETKPDVFNVNYRSPSYLLDIYNKYARKYFTANGSLPTAFDRVEAEENDLKMIEVDGTAEDEINYLIDELLPEILDQSEGQTAFLFRINKPVDQFSNKLNIRNIDHFKISGFDLFSRKIIKDLLAYLSCLNDPLDKLAWSRLFNIFGKVQTLRESRAIVNNLFNIGLKPTDFLQKEHEFQNILELFDGVYRNERIVVFDTETTGLDTANDDIIQIAAVEIISGKIGDKFEVFIKTNKSLESTEHVHKISKEYLLQHGIDHAEALNKFKSFVKDNVIVAHNLDYDYKILQSNLERYCENGMEQTDEQYFDTLDLCRRLYPKLKSYKLEYLIKEFSLKGVNSHNALDDVKATAELINYFHDDLGKKIIEINSFYNDNKNVFEKLRGNFSDLWNKSIEQMEEITDFRSVNNSFFDYAKSNANYSINLNDEPHLEKLNRHMDHVCGKQKLKDLISNYVEEYKRYNEADLIIGNEKILLATVHKAKGLEFENVVIPSCIEGTYPFFHAKTQNEIDEETRVFYVAITRAMKRLILSTYNKFVSQYGKVYAKEKSRFVKSIEDNFNIIEI